MGLGASLWWVVPVDKSVKSPADHPDFEGLLSYERNEPYLYRYYDRTAANPDTTDFTMQATRVVGRFAFAPGKLLPFEFFGDDDLKLYAEAALLGVKNYPHFYEDRMQRLPVMVGFNVPTFKLLDVLSIELEQHLYEYMNSTYHKNKYNNPATVVLDLDIPGAEDLEEELRHIYTTEDNFKWSIFFRKILVDHFRIQGQFAKDHLRLPDYEGVVSNRPSFAAYGDWYYQLKLQYFF